MELLSDFRELLLALVLPIDFSELLLPLGFPADDLTEVEEGGRLVSILVVLLLEAAVESLLILFLITGEDPYKKITIKIHDNPTNDDLTLALIKFLNLLQVNKLSIITTLTCGAASESAFIKILVLGCEAREVFEDRLELLGTVGDVSASLFREAREPIFDFIEVWLDLDVKEDLLELFAASPVD